jgi:hypothetical protein
MPFPTILRALLPLLPCTFALGQQPYHTAQQPQTDWQFAAQVGGILFAIPGIANDFVLSGGGQFVELPNGTARFTGRMLSNSRIYAAFLVDLQFGGRVDPGGAVPAGAPTTTLLPGAYVPNGPVDPAQFHYYTTGAGTLNGVREFDGARVTLALSGPVQVGLGANNRNATPGLAASFTVQVLQQPLYPFGATSTASFTADLVVDRPFYATHVMVNPTYSALASDRALALPGVADDYLFVPAATFTEFADGHAALTGTLARAAQLDDRWQLSLSFGSRVDPGQPGCPPAGSPVLGLLPSAYVAGGGVIDPGSFHYYRTGSGSLTGLGRNAGGSMTLANVVSLQVGGGADQANQYFGLYDRFAVTLVQQPASRTIAVTGPADLHSLTATFPVLPFPVLTDGLAPSLPTLTSQGVVLPGDNLAWVDSLFFGADYVTSTDAHDWFTGWYRVIDNQHVEVHPAPGKAAGSYAVAVFNPAIISNHVAVDLVPPAAPTLCSEAEVRTGRSQHLLAHGGPATGTVLAAFAFSPTLSPSIVPGVVHLDIGSQFADLVVLPGTWLADAATRVAGVTFASVPPSIAGTTLWFQAVVLSLDNVAFPLTSTSTWSTHYAN